MEDITKHSKLNLHCPICGIHMQDEKHYFKHLEEKHNQIMAKDEVLEEMENNKKLLVE